MIPVEIERKYLVTGDEWRKNADKGTLMRQGYMQAGRGLIRIRIAGSEAFITLKGPRRGIRRTEFEYPIPKDHAEHLLEDFCEGQLVEKTRYRVRHGAHIWEVDVFQAANEGLITAEVELEHEEESFGMPGWVGRDVSEDLRYANSNLARLPFTEWATP